MNRAIVFIVSLAMSLSANATHIFPGVDDPGQGSIEGVHWGSQDMHQMWARSVSNLRSFEWSKQVNIEVGATRRLVMSLYFPENPNLPFCSGLCWDWLHRWKAARSDGIATHTWVFMIAAKPDGTQWFQLQEELSNNSNQIVYEEPLIVGQVFTVDFRIKYISDSTGRIELYRDINGDGVDELVFSRSGPTIPVDTTSVMHKFGHYSRASLWDTPRADGSFLDHIYYEMLQHDATDWSFDPPPPPPPPCP